MSIILDALHKVHDQSQYVELSTEESSHFEVLQESRKRRKDQKLKTIGIIMLVFTLAFGILLYINNDYENDKKTLNSYETSSDIETSTPAPQDNVELSAKQFTPQSEKIISEDKNTRPDSLPTPASSIQGAFASVPAAVPDTKQINEQSIPVTESATKTIDEPVIDKKPDTTVKEQDIPIASTTESALTTTPTIPANTVAEAIPHIVLNPVPAWITHGADEFKHGNFYGALKLWHKGFNTLDNDTKLYSVMINYQVGFTRDILFDMIKKNLPCFTLQASLKGRRAYYVMVLPQQNAMETSKAAIKYNTKIDPFALSKQEMLRRIAYLKHITKRKIKVHRHIKPLNIDNIVDQAERDVRSGNYHQAVKLLKPRLKRFHQNWGLLFWLGSAQLGLGNLAQADQLFIDSQKINPNLPQVWTQRALIAQEQNNNNKALDFLFKARDLAPGTPKIILNIAYSYEALNDKNGAVYAYREFLNLTQDQPEYEALRQKARQRINDLVYQQN